MRDINIVRSQYTAFPISLLSYERTEMNTQIRKDGHEKRDASIYRNIQETEQRVVVSTIKHARLHLVCRPTKTHIPSLFDYKLLDERSKRRKHCRFCWRM